MGNFAPCLPSIWQNDWTDKIHQRLSHFWSWRFAKSILNSWYGVSPTNFLVSLTKKVTWGPFLESCNNFPGPENALIHVYHVCIQNQSFNTFENDTMKVSAKYYEAKLTGLWPRNCATIQQVLILKFAFGPKKLMKTFEKRVPGRSYSMSGSS